MLPSSIPIFPLPNVVLFPNVFLPLHVFEPRFRVMVADALEGDRIIGISLLRPGWEDDYDGRPPVYSVGCAGLISHSEHLEDGRYNIVLRGIQKFRILGEVEDESAGHAMPYRVAHIDSLAELFADADRAIVRSERQRLEGLLTQGLERVGGDPKMPTAMADEDLVNALAQYLDLEPVEKQALLECSSLLDRCQSLIDLLEMKLMQTKQPWSSHERH